MKIAKLAVSIFNASMPVHTPNISPASVIMKIIPANRSNRIAEKEVRKIATHWIRGTAATSGNASSLSIGITITFSAPLTVNHFCLDDFLSPAADRVHRLHPQHLIFGFHGFRSHPRLLPSGGSSDLWRKVIYTVSGRNVENRFT